MMATELTWMAWNQAWQLTALIVIAIAIARFAARRRPHLAHVVWLVVLAKCVTPPIVSSPAGLFCWLQPARAAAVEPIGAVSSGSLLAATHDEELATTAAGQERESDGRRPAVEVHVVSPGSDVQIASARELVVGAAQDKLAEPRPDVAPLPEARTTVVQPLRVPLALRCLGILWLAGAALFAAVAALRSLACFRQIRRHRLARNSELEALVAELARRLNVRRRVRVIVTAARVGPAVLGLLRPTVVLPEIIVRGKTPREIEPILAHELIHVRRGDLAIGLWQTLAQGLWWFHPLVWLANRLATRAAEACCDEEVIAGLDCAPDRYARSLLDVLEQRRGLVSLPAFPGMRPVDVTRARLERIMQLGQGCRNRSPWWCWLVLIVAAVAALPGAAFVAAAGDEAQQRQNEKPAGKTEDQQQPPRAFYLNDDLQYFPPGPEFQTVQQARAIQDDRDQQEQSLEPPAWKGQVRNPHRIELLAANAPPSKWEALVLDADSVKVATTARGVDPLIREFDLRGNVELRTQDGSSRASADRGVVVVRNTHKSESRVQDLAIKLSGNVRWISPDYHAASEDVSVLVWVNSKTSRAAVRAMTMRGNARLSANGLAARADDIDAALAVSLPAPRDGKAKPAALPESIERLILVGNVELARNDGANELQSILKAGRLELTSREMSVDEGFRDWRRELDGQRLAHAELDELFASRPSTQWNGGRDPGHPRLRNELQTRSYPVADLVIPQGHIEINTADDDTTLVSKRPANGVDAAEHKNQADFAVLQKLIQETIQPDSWEARSGPGSMVPYRTTLSLVIRQTQAIHEEIADLLGQLRRLQDLQVTLEMLVVTVGTELKVPPHDDGTINLEEKVIALSDVQMTTLRKVLQASEAAAITRCPKATLFNGQGAEFRLRREVPKKEAVAMPALQLAPVIAADRSTVRLQLSFGATKPLDALARGRAFAVRDGKSLLLDVTDEIDEHHLPGLVGAQAAAIRRRHNAAPAERVLLLITPRVVVQEEEEELLGVELPADRRLEGLRRR